MVGLLAVVAVAFGLYLLVTSPNVDWHIVRHYFTEKTILRGVGVTLELTVVSMAAGTALAVVLAAMRGSVSLAMRTVSGAYIWFFRGTPLLVQLIFWYNIALFVPKIQIGASTLETNKLVTPLVAALLALSLNVAAYMAEIIRGGILAIDRGQTEASLALGYTSRQNLFRIVLPQTIRVIVPPTSNLAIDLLKATALVSVIGTGDLLTKAQAIYAVNFRVIELLIVASGWYLIVVTLATIGQGALERRLARSVPGMRVRPPRRATWNRSVTSIDHGSASHVPNSAEPLR